MNIGSRWQRIIQRLARLEMGMGAIALKDATQLFRNRQTLVLFVIAPLFYISIYGFALNPDVQHIPLGIVDYSQTVASRELIATFENNDIFAPGEFIPTQKKLQQKIQSGKIKAGLVISPDFERRLIQQKTVDVQVILDGVNANSTGILNGYVKQIVGYYSEKYDPKIGMLSSSETSGNTIAPAIQPVINILYNPGLISSWYFVPGVLSVVLIGVSTLAAATTMTIEKELGSFDQLIMTPITRLDLLIGKLFPLLILMVCVVILSICFGSLVFNLPIRGSFILFLGVSILFIIIGLEIGLLLGIIANNLLQAYLLSFFITLPIIQLSGSYTPIESMPKFFQQLSLVNPLRHYVAIARPVLLKGTTIEPLILHIIVLGVSILILTLAIYTTLNKTIKT